MTRMRRFCLLLLVLLVLCPQLMLAQMNTGKVTGTVTDKTGAIIAAANVRAIEDGTGTISEADTGTDGSYLLNFLLPGTYRIEVAANGFEKYAASGVVVNAGGNLRIDVPLQVGKATEV